jgi:hypothetical protein
MANRLPLWHRTIVLVIVVLVSSAILVWGYVLNVGKILVHTEQGETVLVNGKIHDPNKEYLAKNYVIRIQKPYHVDFVKDIEVVRNGVVEVFPEFEFIPYLKESKQVLNPQLPLEFQSESYTEEISNLSDYPGGIINASGLPGNIIRAKISPDWSMLWVVDVDGNETMYSTTNESIVWQGKTFGQAFGKESLYVALKDGAGLSINGIDRNGELTELGAVNDARSVGLVASPIEDEVLVINDETGVATLISKQGRTRLESSYAALSGRFSPDGKRLIMQIRLPGATSTVKLNIFDLETGEDKLLDIKAPVELSVFSADSNVLYTFVRRLPNQGDEEEIQQLLDDVRVQALIESLQNQELDFEDFQDEVPADISLSLALIKYDIAKDEYTEIPINNGENITSQSLYLDLGGEGELLLLRPGYIDTIVIADTNAL